jgi:hypothetical protein
MRTVLGRTPYLSYAPSIEFPGEDTSRQDPATLRVRPEPVVQGPLCSAFAKNAMRVLWLPLRSLGQEG